MRILIHCILLAACIYLSGSCKKNMYSTEAVTSPEAAAKLYMQYYIDKNFIEMADILMVIDKDSTEDVLCSDEINENRNLIAGILARSLQQTINTYGKPESIRVDSVVYTSSIHEDANVFMTVIFNNEEVPDVITVRQNKNGKWQAYISF